MRKFNMVAVITLEAKSMKEAMDVFDMISDNEDSSLVASILQARKANILVVGDDLEEEEN